MNNNYIFYNLIIIIIRPYWRCYYANTDAIVYVIDSADKDRLNTARAELSSMLQVNNRLKTNININMHMIPFLFHYLFFLIFIHRKKS